ncbi:hypothetical protein F4677DRAFT_462745 [Hypoxylon crocopeplum]|nr:hypothetical protein F4677DRAFT_462745 [Hypoxylon crocopeplum]
MVSTKSLASMIITGCLLRTVEAECQISNAITDEQKDAVSQHDALCLPQGEGQWTFAMSVTLKSYPALGGLNGQPLFLSDNSFLIFDNACKTKGIYPKPSCGIPYTIKENFLPLVMSVTSVFFDVGDPSFEMHYGDGAFITSNNHCVCGGVDSSVLSETKGCRCAFPLDGTFEKRGLDGFNSTAIEFRA